MGNRTTVIGSPGPYTDWPSGSGTMTDDKIHGPLNENGYIDGIVIYCGSHTGAAMNFIFGFYTSNTLRFTSQTFTTSGYGWLTGVVNPPQFQSPTTFQVGIWASGVQAVGIDKGNANFYFHSGGSSPNGVVVSGSPSPFGYAGGFFAYVTYFVPCHITSTPAGSWLGGQTIQVQGESFTAGVTSVSIGGTNCPTYHVDSDTQISITIPDPCNSGQVTVNTNAGNATSSGSVTILPTCKITSTPGGFFLVGDTVTVTGQSFSYGVSAVYLNGVACSFSVINDTTLNLTVPSGATTGRVTLTATAATSTVTSPSNVTVVPNCQIFSVPSTLEHIGDSFQITGVSFSEGVSAVDINGTTVTSYSIDSDSQMTLTVPSGAQTGFIHLTAAASHATVTSPSVVQIGPGGWFHNGGVINRVKGVWYKSGGVIRPVKGIWYKSGGTLHQTK